MKIIVASIFIGLLANSLAVPLAAPNPEADPAVGVVPSAVYGYQIQNYGYPYPYSYHHGYSQYVAGGLGYPHSYAAGYPIPPPFTYAI